MERRGGSGYPYKKGSGQSRSHSPAPGSGCMELSELLGVGIKGIATGSSDTSLPGLNLAIGDNGAEGVTEGKGLTGRKSDSKSDITMKEKEKGGSQQMVDILQAQRDRYKDRLSVVCIDCSCPPYFPVIRIVSSSSSLSPISSFNCTH